MEHGTLSKDDWANSGSDEDDLLETDIRMENSGDNCLHNKGSSSPVPQTTRGQDRDEDALVPEKEADALAPG